MIIDFSFSIDDWMALFQRLIDIIVNFFDKLGIKLFADEETTAPEEETTA
ncbi:MAG: hypothetical protein IKL47_13825 [Clostridia bacterium]|nr:hypothetical protein [Clostridia bacterium]